MPQSPPQVQSVLCPLCASRTAAAFIKQGFPIRRCTACAFLFVHPQPADGTAELYNGGYFCGAGDGFGYMNYEDDKIAMRPFFERVLDVVESARPLRGAFLDVGAATGFFLKLAVGRGWAAKGVEVSDYACRVAEAAGLTVHCGTLESASFPEASFDVITLLDVIEHVPSPKATIAECQQVLKPGGLIFLNTPDTASLWARLFGKRWHAYCPPEHLSCFNAANLSRLLEHSGFRVLRVGKISKHFTPAYTASMLHRWHGFSFWDRIAKYLERSRMNRIFLPVDIRDNFFVMAEKI